MSVGAKRPIDPSPIIQLFFAQPSLCRAFHGGISLSQVLSIGAIGMLEYALLGQILCVFVCRLGELGRPLQHWTGDAHFVGDAEAYLGALLVRDI